MDLTVLNDIGLTHSEIKVYLALLELGSARAADVIGLTGMPNSVFHLSANGLIKKGFVSFYREGNIRHFQAAPPENIVNYVESKKQGVLQLLDYFREKQKPVERHEAEVFHGFAGFKAMHYKLIEDGQRGDDYLYFGYRTDNVASHEKIFKFHGEFEVERERRGLVVKGIVREDYAKHMQQKKANMVIVDFPTPSNMSIFRNRVIMIPWVGGSETSFMITSQALADNLKSYFYSIWSKYKH